MLSKGLIAAYVCVASIVSNLSGAAWAQSAPATEAAAPVETAPVATIPVPASGAEVPPPLIPTSSFAESSLFSNAQLSPAGDRIAATVTAGGYPSIILADPVTRTALSRYRLEDNLDIEWFRWAGNNRILLSVSVAGAFDGEEVRYTRLFVIDLETGETRFIGRKDPIVDGDDVIHLAEDGSYALVSMQRSIYDYPSVYKFELQEGGSVREVQSQRDGVWEWSADSDGVVRIGWGWMNGRLRIFYRSSADNDLDLVGKFREGDDAARYWTVSYIKAGSDIGYVLEENAAGRLALKSYDFLNRKSLETIYENADWDVEEATIGKDGLPRYVEYTDDREQIVWLDQQGKRTQAMLEKALNVDVVRIISTARDESRMLVWAGAANDPGALYVFTPGEKKLDQFAEMRKSVPFMLLAKPKPFTYEARDGVKIRAYLTLPRGREAENLPLIILPHGGPYGVRDELRYDDEVQFLANRGYAVLQPNYRGSDGYGDDFSELGRGQIGRKMQDDLDDAMDWAVAQGMADKDRVCVVGGSYGGYAALWAVLRNPERYRCAASWAGVTDFKSQLRYDRSFFSGRGARKWRERVQGEEEFDLDLVSPAKNAKTLNRPVLLAHGDEDSRVPFSQYKKMRDATKNAPMPPELLVIEGEGHSFSSAENEQKWYDALEAFLARHNPADAAVK